MYASIENVASIADLHNFSVSIGMSFPCIDDSRIPCSSILVMMQQVSLCERKYFSLSAQFPVGQSNLFLSIDLGISNYEFWVGVSPVFWGWANSFSFVVIPRIDQRCRTLWRDFLFALTVLHQIGASGFCHPRAFFWIGLLSSFRHGTRHNRLSVLRERKFSRMAARICRKAHDIEQTQEVIPFISRETSFGQNVGELVLGVHIFNVDIGFQVDSAKQPIKSNSVSSWHMTHCGTSSFDYHFDSSFIVFKKVQLRLSMRRMCVGGYVIHLTPSVNLLFSCDMLGLGFGIKNCPSFLVACMFGLNTFFGFNVKLQSLWPNDWEQVTHQYVIQHPEKWLQTLWSCAKEKFVSCTSNWLWQKFDFPKYTRHHLRLLLSPQVCQQSLSLGKNPVCSTVPRFPHDNIDGSHSCDEFKKSALLIVYHILESILWLTLQACSLNTRCQVVQFVPNTSISRQFASKLLKILQQIQVPPVCIDDDPNKDAKLFKDPLRSCLPVHSVVRRIFWACSSMS